MKWHHNPETRTHWENWELDTLLERNRKYVRPMIVRTYDRWLLAAGVGEERIPPEVVDEGTEAIQAWATATLRLEGWR